MPRFPGNPPSPAFKYRALMELARNLALADRQHQVVLRRVRRAVSAAQTALATKKHENTAGRL
jgi:hypothetical protein